jgi:hypothetical protein
MNPALPHFDGGLETRPCTPIENGGYTLDGWVLFLMGKIQYKLSDRSDLSTPDGGHEGNGAARRDDILINGDLVVN